MKGSASRARQKAETRQRIIAAATGLFIEKGYEGTTVREIAGLAEVSAGNIFVHFPDKLALLVETLRSVINTELENAMETFPWDAKLTAQLLHFPRHFYGYYGRQPALVREVFRETLLGDSACMAPLNEQMSSHVRLAGDLFERAKDRGEIKATVNSGTAATAYFSYYMALLIEFLKSPTRDPNQTVAKLEMLIEQLLEGVGV